MVTKETTQLLKIKHHYRREIYWLTAVYLLLVCNWHNKFRTSKTSLYKNTTTRKLHTSTLKTILQAKKYSIKQSCRLSLQKATLKYHRQKGKGKVFPYSLPSVGPGADPGVQAVSLQVTRSESRHTPSSSLPLLSARHAFTFVALTRWRYL